MKNLKKNLFHFGYLLVIVLLTFLVYERSKKIQLQKIETLEAKVDQQVAIAQAEQAASMAMQSNEMARMQAERSKNLPKKS